MCSRKTPLAAEEDDLREGVGSTGKEVAREETCTETLQDTVGLASSEQLGGKVSECDPSV